MSALNRFTLIQPELTLIAKTFYEINNIESNKNSKHYQFVGATSKQITQNMTKIHDMLIKFDVTFENGQYLHNIVSKAVIPENHTIEIINHEEEHISKVVDITNVWDLFKSVGKTLLYTFKICITKK